MADIIAEAVLFIIGIVGIIEIRTDKSISPHTKFFGTIFWGGFAYGSVVIKSEAYLQWVYLLFIATAFILFRLSLAGETSDISTSD